MGETKWTPGPWRWELNQKHKVVNLCGGNPKAGFGRYDMTVMQFARWGMSGAQPRFLDEEHILRPAHSFAAVVPGREHHADWFQAVDHPDAHLIAAAPDLYEALEHQLRNCWACKGAREVDDIVALVKNQPARKMPCGRCASGWAALARARGETPSG